MSVNLAELAFADDLDVGMDPETFVDQATPAPIYAGNYALRVDKYSQRKNKDGSTKLVDGKFPIIVLETVTVVEGAVDKDDNPVERKFGLFADIPTKPFQREGVMVTRLGDITRAYDQTRQWRGLQEGLAVLQEFLDTNQIFRVQLNWLADDYKWSKSERERKGLGSDRNWNDFSDEEKKAINDIYNKAKLEGMSKFPKHGNGRPNHVWANAPGGEPVEAKVVIKRFFPSGETVKLGSFFKG